jgi:hypothetical protein
VLWPDLASPHNLRTCNGLCVSCVIVLHRLVATAIAKQVCVHGWRVRAAGNMHYVAGSGKPQLCGATQHQFCIQLIVQVLCSSTPALKLRTKGFPGQ